LVAAAGCALTVAIAWGRADPGAATPVDPLSIEHSGSPAVRPPAAAPQPVVPAHRAGSVRPEVPDRSVLPDGTVVPVRPAGTAADGSLDVPDDIRVAGWWRGSARLGDPFGSTLLAAHVDSTRQGLGPYAGLLAVRPGQRITLASHHLTQAYAVVSLALVPHGALSEHPRIFSARGPRRLTLVTCAGPYRPELGGYQNLAVVTARPVADVAVRGAR
jgi:hypothetical protein